MCNAQDRLYKCEYQEKIVELIQHFLNEEWPAFYSVTIVNSKCKFSLYYVYFMPLDMSIDALHLLADALKI